jgi:VWFA-related protein
MGLMPRARFASDNGTCPPVNYYEADQILNWTNPLVLDTMKQWVMEACPPVCHTPEQCNVAAEFLAKAAANVALRDGEIESEYVYRFLEDVLRQLANKPGERVMVLASPGFINTQTHYLDLSGVIDRANRSNIVINTLDARGLYRTDTMGDISDFTNISPGVAGRVASLQMDAQFQQADVLRDFAYGTGGIYYGNSNDLAAGLNELAAVPEVSYVLGFNPHIQKMDGTFHALKVTLVQKTKYTIQARHGYFIPRRLDDPVKQEHQEIVEAAFSRDEILDLPLQIQTQFFKGDTGDARLSVVSRIDVNGLHVRKADGWNLGNLTVVTVVFDDNGNYVSGLQKVVQLKLTDPVYQKMLRLSLTVKSDVDLKPGHYLVRQIVRESESAQIAARNGSVDIP